MKEKILKIINDNSVPHQSSEYGEGIFTDIDAVNDIVESVVKLFAIPDVSRSSSDEPKNINDFIYRALQISEDKRKLPLVTDCPNGLEVFPNIKMRLKKGTEFTQQQEVEKMVITWHD